MRHGPQPSIIAASSSSRGMPRKNCTIRKMKKASTARNFGTTSGRKVFDPVEVEEQHVLRDQRHVVGQHQRAQHQREPEVPARELQPREGVGRQRAGDHVADHRQDRDDRSEFRKNVPKLTRSPFQPRT